MRFAAALCLILSLMVGGHPGRCRAADVHDIHARGAGARPCSDCHAGSRHDGGSGTGGSGTIEVPEASGENATLDFAYVNGSPDTDGAYSFATRQCTDVDCHGGAGSTTSAVQNTETALKCGTCHPAGADADDFTYGNGVLAKINAAEWGSSGHGAAGTYDSGNPGADLAGPGSDPEGCAYCHDFAVAHGDAANPFRLVDQPGASGWNDTCLVCHATGDAGYDPDGAGTGYALRGHSAASEGKPADASHYGAAHINAGDGGRFCWDCHDPHGDRSGGTGNISMIQSAVSRATDGVLGVPVATQAVNFTRTTIGDLTTPGYYVETANNPATGICQACHGDGEGFSGEVKYWRGNQTEDADGDGTSESTPPASRHNADGVCTGCHQHRSGFEASCEGCHSNAAMAATTPQVSIAVGNHTDHDGSGSETPTCKHCHPGHSGGVTVPMPPTAYTVTGLLTNVDMAKVLGFTPDAATGKAWDYGRHGGIHLGGSATAGGTEAEICWNCHSQAAVNVSEWGPSPTSPLGYDYGQLTAGAPSWIGATWQSGRHGATPSFAYKAGAIRSTHTGAVDLVSAGAIAAPGVDAVAQIRCSYCHDVHNLNAARLNATYRDTASGRPFLRGSFKGNPFPEDGAPQSGTVYPHESVGPFPRVRAQSGGADRNMYGGYQLNQNNRTAMGAAPGSVWTLAESAGLCVLCHSDNVNAMNQFGTPSADWVGTNGHSGAAIGGTATLAANIYREAVATRTGYQARNPNYLGTGTSYNTSSTRGSSGVGRPAIGQHNMDDQSRLYGFRSVTGEGFDVPPQLSLYGYPEGNKTAVMKSFDWDASATGTGYPVEAMVNDATTSAGYHAFPCSKCHNPHASRLPRLMITNCLDIRHETWKGGAASNTLAKTAGTLNAPKTDVMDTWNAGRYWSATTAAVNCHRRGDTAAMPSGHATTNTPGWNLVTPW